MFEKLPETLKKDADENGFTNVMFFVDDGYSGTNFNRPDWQRLVGMIDEGLIGIIIVKDMSRLGRDYLQVGMYTEIPELTAEIIRSFVERIEVYQPEKIPGTTTKKQTIAIIWNFIGAVDIPESARKTA